MIPKIIYQTWKTDKILDILKIVQTRIKLQNSNYEYKFYTDEDILEYIQTKCDERTIRAYNKLTIGAAKADFWRYLILYDTGGVYLDMDSDICRPIDELIQQNANASAIISREGNHGVFLQWLLIFEPKHPILKRTIELCIENIEKHGQTKDVVSLTGPRVFSQAVCEYLRTEYAYDLPDNLYKSVCLYKVDYGEYARWKHEFANYLYVGHEHWTQQAKFL